MSEGVTNDGDKVNVVQRYMYHYLMFYNSIIMQPNIMGELLVHESEYLVSLAIRVVNLHDFVEICSPVRVNVSQYHPGHVFLPWCALSTHSAYDLGQQVGCKSNNEYIIYVYVTYVAYVY